jgi:hypothetical protein
VVNPGGGFEFPTVWTSVQAASTWNMTNQDFAYRLEGSESSTAHSLGDRVWNDTDHDGIQDSGEPGKAGVAVQLYSNSACSGAPAASDTTDISGIYGFANLSSGTYCLQFTRPSGWTISPQNKGSNEAKDSDANPTTGRITGISLTANNLSQDVGLYTAGPSESYVFLPFVPRTVTNAGYVASKVVRTGEEGQVEHPAGAKIFVPRGAVPPTASGAAGEMLFTIEKGRPQDFGASSTPPTGWQFVGDVFQMTPEGFTFEMPVQAPMPLPEGFDTSGKELVMFDYDQEAGKWVQVGGRVDADGKTFTADMLHL